jgi:hypothetical protein
VLKPISVGCRYDLVIDEGDRFIRVQCKTGVLRQGRVVFRVYSVDASRPRPRSYHGQVEAFGVYCPGTMSCYLVPMDAVISCDTMVALRVIPSRNGQTRGIRLAEEYVIPNDILLAEALLSSLTLLP